MKPQVYEIIVLGIVLTVSLLGCTTSPPSVGSPNTSVSDPESDWQKDFDLSTCTMITNGSNQYFILEPGFQLILEGGTEKLVITVLNETVEIDGTQTRVIEEREWKNGELIEVSRNFFAICEQTKDVFYFGEEVDMYQAGQLTSHSGAWRSGKENARFGLIMPGYPVVGMKYYQEIAPGMAMDRAEIVSLDETLMTPVGQFSKSLKTREGNALNLLEVEYKTYASGIGLIQDEILLLTGYGFVNSQ